MNYDFLKEKTLDKLNINTIWKKQINDLNIVDVSLNIGPFLPTNRKIVDTNLELFATNLSSHLANVSAIFLFIDYIPKNKLHSIILTIFNDTPNKFDACKLNIYDYCKKF